MSNRGGVRRRVTVLVVDHADDAVVARRVRRLVESVRIVVGRHVPDLHQVLVRVPVEMVQLVALVKDLGNSGRGRCVRDGRRDHVDHVAMVLLLRDLQLFLAVEATDRSQMDITAEDRHPNFLAQRKLLQAPDQSGSFFLVQTNSPVISFVSVQISASHFCSTHQ